MMQSADQTSEDAYNSEVLSNKKNNLYRQVLLACASAQTDDLARPSQYRERLISRETGSDIVPDDFAFAVVEVMPGWVKEVIKNAFPRRAEDFTDLQRQLQELLNKYKVKIQGRRIEPTGLPSAEDAGERAAGEEGERGGSSSATKSLRTPRRRFHETPEQFVHYAMTDAPPKLKFEQAG